MYRIIAAMFLLRPLLRRRRKACFPELWTPFSWSNLN
jgi:hypothetical protein